MIKININKNAIGTLILLMFSVNNVMSQDGPPSLMTYQGHLVDGVR